MRLSSSPTHQSISGPCWTRAYFRDGSNCDMSAQTGHVRFTADYGSEARQGVGWREPCSFVNGWRAPKPFKALASVVNAKELNALPSVLVKRIIEDIRRYQT